MQPTTSRLPLLTYAFALFATAVTIAIAVFTNTISLKDLITPVLSIFGTFFGATFAFRITEEKELRKLLNSRREALNRASFILIRQANAIHQLYRDFERFPSPFEKAFNLPALKPPSYQDLEHTLSDLDFLLDSSNPSLLMEVAIEQERFHQALESLRARNEFYVEEVQPAIANSNSR